MSDAMTAVLPVEDRRLWWMNHTGELTKKAQSNVELALNESGLDWDVLESPIRINHNGKWKSADDAKAIIRSDNGRPLGFVRDRYTPIQHRDALAVITDVAGRDDAQIERCWSLRDGRKVVVAVRYGHDVDIMGIDALRPYLLFETSHDGSGACRMMISPVQVSCLNQLPSLRSDATFAKAVHHGNVSKGLDAAADIIRSAEIGLERRVQQMCTLASNTISRSKCTELIADIVFSVPGTEQRREKDCERIASVLASTSTLNDDLRMTGFGLFHAVSEYTTHAHPQRSIGGWHRHMSSSRYSRMCRNSMNRLLER